MDNSGFKRTDWPLLSAIIYTYHTHICLLWASFIILSMALTVKKGSVSYQLGTYGVIIIAAVYCVSSMALQPLIAFEGRYLYCFPMVCVTINDACAFFAGITFGKTKLIALSPNKTWEGFIGGMICNVVGTYLWCQSVDFTNGFMYCAPDKHTMNFYENWKCDELDPIYKLEKYFLPFRILGVDSI